MHTLGELHYGALAIALVVAVVVFLVIRELLCWYWKVNQAIALLTEIRDHLAAQTLGRKPGAQTPSSAGTGQIQNPVLVDPMGICPHCALTVPRLSVVCPHCNAALVAGGEVSAKPR